MGNHSSAPSESEWQIMEMVWRKGDGITSAEIVQNLRMETDMSERTIRVLLSRLCEKGLLTYDTDAHDRRIYHYRAVRGRDECLAEKSRAFIDHYFHGSGAGAIAAFIDHIALSEEQIRELEDMLNEKR